MPPACSPHAIHDSPNHAKGIEKYNRSTSRLPKKLALSAKSKTHASATSDATMATQPLAVATRRPVGSSRAAK
mgnify:CR=1 FL=1